MNYIIDYEIKNDEKKDLTPEEQKINKDKFELNTYASFCMSFVEQIKNKLDFEKYETTVKKDNKDVNVIRYKMIMPVIKRNINKINKSPINPVKYRTAANGNKYIPKKEKVISNEPKGAKNKCRNSASLLK